MLPSRLRQLPPAAWILFGGTFINRFGTFVMPMLVLYLARRGFSVAQSGIAVGAYGAGHLATSLLGGYLADRIGRRRTIVLSMFASAAAMLALSQARGYGAIVALTFAAGLSAELYRPASSALLGDCVAVEHRLLAFGLYRFAINLGFAAGPATAGFLAERSSFYVFLGDAASSILFGVIALVSLPNGVRRRGADEHGRGGFGAALADRPFVMFLLASIAVTWVVFQQSSTLPLHLAKAGFSPAQYGVLISINGVLIVAFEIALTLWLQRFPAVPLIAIGYALTGIGWALTGFAHTLLALAGTVVVWSLAEMIFAPVMGACVTNLAPEPYRGRYHGLHTLTWSIGMLVGPVLGTMLYARSEALLWSTCAASGALAAVLLGAGHGSWQSTRRRLTRLCRIVSEQRS